jgi:hypothetical protein
MFSNASLFSNFINPQHQPFGYQTPVYPTVIVAEREHAVLLSTVTFTDSSRSFTQPHQQPAAVKFFFAGVQYQQQRTTGYCKRTTGHCKEVIVSTSEMTTSAIEINPTPMAFPQNHRV